MKHPKQMIVTDCVSSRWVVGIDAKFIMEVSIQVSTHPVNGYTLSHEGPSVFSPSKNKSQDSDLCQNPYTDGLHKQCSVYPEKC